MATTDRTLTLTLAPHGIDCRVALEGVDVSQYVTGIEVIARVHERTRVTLELLAGVEVAGPAGELLRGLVPTHARPIVEVVDVPPGSALVVRARGHLSQEARERLAAQLRQVWPDPATRIAVVDDTVSLSVFTEGRGDGGAPAAGDGDA
jgi:hypothetical protein